MQRGIGPEGEFAKIALLHLDEQLLVFSAQAFQNAGMDHDAELKIRFIPRTFLQDFAQLALYFHAHGQGALHFAPAFAVGAIVVDGGAHAFRMPLARHFHQPKLRNGQNVCFGPVPPQALFHPLINRLLVAPRFHIDEVEHD